MWRALLRPPRLLLSKRQVRTSHAAVRDRSGIFHSASAELMLVVLKRTLRAEQTALSARSISMAAATCSRG